MQPKSIYEDIAQVYLRLNNFFLTPNLVIELDRHPLEIDIIAYRPKGATEYLTSNRRLEIDKDFFNLLTPKGTIDGLNIALICDVKGESQKLWRADNPKHIEVKITHPLTLFGINTSKKEVRRMTRELIKNGTYRYKELIIALVGFAKESTRKPHFSTSTEVKHIIIPIEHALNFIINRIKKVKEKERAIIHYPNISFKTLILLHRTKLLK